MTARSWIAWLVPFLVLGGARCLDGQSSINALPDTLDHVEYRRLVGARAEVRFAPPDSLVAARVIDLIDAQAPLPGLPDSVPYGVRAVLTHSVRAFAEVTQGAAPEWSAGVAVPFLNLLVIPSGSGQWSPGAEGRRTLRHEWAHLGLSQAVEGLRAPRWFNEGYAQWASGGFDASESWRLRVLIALGRTPPMDSLTLRWPAGRAEAEVAYLLSASAVTHLLEAGGERGLAVFVGRWRSERSFDSAFRGTFGVTVAQFEEDWKKHVKDRYGWLFVLSHSAIFWGLLALVLLALVFLRQPREREKLARLRAGDPPDEPAYWTKAGSAGGSEKPSDGVYKP